MLRMYFFLQCLAQHSNQRSFQEKQNTTVECYRMQRVVMYLYAVRQNLQHTWSSSERQRNEKKKKSTWNLKPFSSFFGHVRLHSRCQDIECGEFACRIAMRWSSDDVINMPIAAEWSCLPSECAMSFARLKKRQHSWGEFPAIDKMEEIVDDV